MKLSELGVERPTQDLVTPFHEEWLVTHDDLEYSQEALDFAAKQLSSKDRDRTQGFSASGLGSCHLPSQVHEGAIVSHLGLVGA